MEPHQLNPSRHVPDEQREPQDPPDLITAKPGAVIGLLVLAAGCLIASLFALQSAIGQAPGKPAYYKVVNAGDWVIVNQDRRVLHIRKQSVSGMGLYGPGKHIDNALHWVVLVQMGAKEFRFDTANQADAQEFIDAFIGADKETDGQTPENKRTD